MLRATASKVMWVGRSAATVFGLALVLALLLGAATMALAAVPGDPFRLGQTNGIDRISTLVGNVATPMLRIDNGSTAAGATALDLRVEPGKSPLRVNSATRVPNLNADKVDGKSDTDFYAAGSKVADSSHADQADSATSAGDADTLDTKDSTEFLGADQKASNADNLDGLDSTEFAKAYERTVVVSPVGTDTENGQALLNAISNITDASATKPYLLHIEPATYDLGTRLNTGSLNMKPFVDIEGSGELNTIITSGIPTNCQNTRPGTVNGASNAEMRFLTVRNTAQICTVAISNLSASPRLTHLTAENTGGNQQESAVWNRDNSNPTMTDVTATTSTAFFNHAVWSTDSSPTIRQSKLNGGTGQNSSALFQIGVPAKVALTQLVGGVRLGGSGSVQCFNNYDENMAAVNC